MRDIILLKQGEMVLKGLNKHRFDQRLQANIRYRIRGLGKFKVYSRQSIVYVEPADDSADVDAAFEALRTVFGVVTLSRAAACEKTREAIAALAIDYLRPAMPSEGRRKPLRGDTEKGSTAGPSIRQERLNCWEKRRRQ